MKYGIPQKGRTPHSNRVKILRMEADTAADEMFLTELSDGLKDGTLQVLRIEFSDGREFTYALEPTGED